MRRPHWPRNLFSSSMIVLTAKSSRILPSFLARVMILAAHTMGSLLKTAVTSSPHKSFASQLTSASSVSETSRSSPRWSHVRSRSSGRPRRSVLKSEIASSHAVTNFRAPSWCTGTHSALSCAASLVPAMKVSGKFSPRSFYGVNKVASKLVAYPLVLSVDCCRHEHGNGVGPRNAL